MAEVTSGTDSFIQPVYEAPHLSSVDEIFADIENCFGMVPNLFRTYAHHPPLLDANWRKVKRVMMDGSLPRLVKEVIAVLVSKDNACRYCVAAHTAALRSLGKSDADIKRIEAALDDDDLSANHKLLIRFARQANRNPLRIDSAERIRLRDAGITDAEIIEALGVMELFTSFNKFLDALDVGIDFPMERQQV